MKTAPQRLEENILHWAQGSDADKARVAAASNPGIAPIGEANLTEDVAGHTLFFHREGDPAGEALEWCKTLDLRNTHVLFVYGIGMGHAYDVWESWLRENQKHSLVFIENDPDVLKHFFTTERASRMLQDSQVWLFLLGDFRREFAKFDAMTSLFVGEPFKVSALHYYLINRSERLMELNTIISFTMNMKRVIHSEYNAMGVGFFVNFYRNLLSLPKASIAHAMYGRFEGVPAIICGAGPSLQKQLDTLKSMKDRALIFAGGTAMNVLNYAGIEPHFGVGIDPNSEQVMRLMANTAFQTPYFYRNRMNFSALHFVHGDRILVNGSSSYPIAGWVEEQLGIAGPTIDEGHNVINFSLAIAHALGCNPIITVGVDLAYTHEESYAPLADRHPISFGKHEHRTKDSSEELLVRKDIYGEPVYTLWKWLMESVWYSRFLLDHAELNLINATEGGLGFPGVPNIPLAEIEQLDCCYDFEALIHGEIQNAAMPSHVDEEAVVTLLATIEKSLLASGERCSELQQLFSDMTMAIATGARELPGNLITEEVLNEIVALDEEVAYSKILAIFNDHCFRGFTRELDRLDRELSCIGSNEVQQRRAELNFQRYKFLVSAAARNAALLRSGLAAFAAHQKQLELAPAATAPRAPGQPYGGRYQLEDGQLTLCDEELGLDISEPFEPQWRGVLRQGVQYEQTYKDGQLHGCSRAFSSAGVLLYEGWYLNGKREGKAIGFNLEGQVSAISRYRNGKKMGAQERYYPDSGQVRSVATYRDGQLDGAVCEYYPNGAVKRRLSFCQGKKEGQELMFNYDGQQLVEAHYCNGQAVGSATYHDGAGRLMRRMTYDTPGHVDKVEVWDEAGNPVEAATAQRSDYFDDVALLTKKLTEALQGVCQQVDTVAPILAEGGEDTLVDEIAGDLAEVKEQIASLEKLSDAMYEEVGLDPNSSREPIWKTPSLQQNVEDRLKLVTQEVGESLLSVQTVLKSTLDRLFGSSKE